MAEVVTVREAVQRAKQDGFPITEYSLRLWIRSGAIPVRRTGTKGKILLYYPNVIRFLQCADGADNAPAPTVVSGIRRIEVQ